MTTNRTGAVYLRLSTALQGGQTGSQYQFLTRWAESQGIAVLPEWFFEDIGESGDTSPDVRPALSRLLAVAGDPGCPFNSIVTSAPDRLSRDTDDLVAALLTFRSFGIDVYTPQTGPQPLLDYLREQ